MATQFNVTSASLVLTLLSFLAFTGCSSASKHQSSCEESDWYELGRRDGAQGATSDRLKEQSSRCGDDFKADWETMYVNGRNAGLVEYCEAKNGYELGRMGISYFYVCPSTAEPEFLVSYRKGQKARDLEQENSKLNLQIDELAKRLMATNDQYDQRQIASELTELKKTRTEKEKELAKMVSN